MNSSPSSRPLVSVVMGTYNAAPYLREALDSVLAQTYPHMEILVADDVSTDNTVEILRSYGDRLRLFFRERNSGRCQFTRNLCLRHASGKYAAFVDQDDAWLPHKLERQVAFMEAHPEIPLSHTYCEVIDQDSRSVEVRHRDRLPPTGRCVEELLAHCFITISSAMVRRDALETTGLFSEDPSLLNDDYEFFLRFAMRYPVGLVDEVLVRYRKSQAGVMHDKWQHKPEASPFFAWLLAHPEGWRGYLTAGQISSALLRACRRNARFWVDQGRYDRALHFCAAGLRARPWDGPLRALQAGAALRQALRGQGP